MMHFGFCMDPFKKWAIGCILELQNMIVSDLETIGAKSDLFDIWTENIMKNVLKIARQT